MNKRPFGLTADLEFLYVSDQHKRVFEETLSAVRRRDGLVCVIGEPGTGKTILCRRLSQELNGSFKVALVSNPPRTPNDMTEALDDAFGAMDGDSRIPLAVFDEAHHFDFRCLDHVKFLTNLEKKAERLLQIVLVGQPGLADKLRHRRFHQLEQRIGAKLSVRPLAGKEVLPYLTHRLTIAGLAKKIRFTKSAARYLYRKTSGIPKLINEIANLAVDRGLERGQADIGIRDIKEAFSKVAAARDPRITPRKSASSLTRLSLLFLVPGLSVALLVYYHPAWRAFFSPATTRSVSARPQFVVKAGTFLNRDQAAELRDQLGKQGFPAAIVEKQFGDGWVLYQVRLAGQYSKDEADNVTEILRTIGVKSVDAIETKP